MLAPFVADVFFFFFFFNFGFFVKSQVFIGDFTPMWIPIFNPHSIVWNLESSHSVTGILFHADNHTGRMNVEVILST